MGNWQNRLGTIRASAVVVVMAVVGLVWLIRH
jgi:hypothetical protein